MRVNYKSGVVCFKNIQTVLHNQADTGQGQWPTSRRKLQQLRKSALQYCGLYYFHGHIYTVRNF